MHRFCVPIGLGFSLLATSIAALAAPTSTPMTAQISEQKLRDLPAHPRLFSNAARFVALKNQKDAVSIQLRALLHHEADRYLGAAPITYPPTGFLFGPAREVQGRVLTLALRFRLTGEKPYFEAARRELLQLAALSEWRPSHFLDVGEAALAAAVGLDWLYDELLPAERDQIAEAIERNALLPSLEVKVGGDSWMNGDFNWNSVCNAGLIVGALAIGERQPKLAQQVLERATQSLPFAAAAYVPDGTYAEGPSYWSYGTTFQVIAIEALRSALGTSFDLERAPGFLQTTDFMAQMLAPSGKEYNFSDYHGGEARSLSEPVMLWFARETGKRAAANDELANLQKLADSLQKDGAAPHLSRHLALELLWWNPALSNQKNASALPLQWTAGGHLPLAVMRSAWNDPNATYLAIKGGTPNGSHAHMDVGSFILEAQGVRWALDLGTESYNLMRAAKLDLWNYSQESSRWTTFRVGPESHNILRFGGARQDVSGHATISALPSETGAVVDLTSHYQSQVEAATRTFKLLDDRSVTIEDGWKTGAREASVTWQWLTKADVTRTPTGFLLRQAGKTLELQVEASAPFETEIEDVSAPRGPQDSPNPGLKRLLIRLPSAARSEGKLTVRAMPR